MDDEQPDGERVSSTKGIEIFVRSFPPAGRPRAALVICHGVNSHGGQYLWAAGQLALAGFATFTLDLRGRGRSGGERYYVDEVADYVADVATVIQLAKARHPGLPVFQLGHSAPRLAGSGDKSLKLYDGHFYDLMNDIGKEAVLADMRSRIEDRIH